MGLQQVFELRFFRPAGAVAQPAACLARFPGWLVNVSRSEASCCALERIKGVKRVSQGGGASSAS